MKQLAALAIIVLVLSLALTMAHLLFMLAIGFVLWFASRLLLNQWLAQRKLRKHIIRKTDQ